MQHNVILNIKLGKCKFINIVEKVKLINKDICQTNESILIQLSHDYISI